MITHLCRLVFVDETGFRTHMGRKRGRASKGERVVCGLRKRSPSYTLIGGMGLYGMVGKWLIPKAITLPKMIEYIEQVLIPELPAGSWVIWDNWDVHRAPWVQYLFRKAGVILLFQARYSPDMNPIEQAWTKIKTLVRGRRPRSAKELREAVAWAWDQIDRLDISNFFEHAGLVVAPPINSNCSSIR